ncbi:hypothetical protein HNQ92_003918 [Rhabdobacter roseus]|uniref:Outer membrane protein beta-barrel domain-containing protein n=1 Tax=Rhabdobacter roseus TaxID=1655419 RepID=A0A840U023_9BACT|nr:porin family protein [Rhabdobacter roseus]MBB5285758.1 hypothetical protein [Rhabdobacter roseus]
MKKILLLVVAACAGLSVAEAQTHVRVNPKVGVHLSALNTEESLVDAGNARAGASAGLDLRIGARKFFFQPGIFISGTTLDFVNENTTGTEIRNRAAATFVRVPLNAGVYLVGNNSQDVGFRIRANAGVIPAYLVGYRNREAQGNIARADINDFQTNLNAGIGFDLGPITIDAGAEFGINNYFSRFDGKTVALGLKAGFVF